MDVDRPKSPDRRSKAYAMPIHFTVRHWTSFTDPATSPPRPTALDALTVHALANASGTETGSAATGTVTNTTTDAGVVTIGTGPARGPTATGITTATGSETESGIGIENGGGIVMVSAVAVKETEPEIDIAIETARGTGTGNANVNVTGTAIGTMTGTTGTTKTDAGSVEKTRISMEMSAARGSDLTKVLKNRLSQPRHPPPACLHLHRLSLTARVAELDLANPTVGTATGRLGVLATRGMTLTSLLAFASGSVAVH